MKALLVGISLILFQNSCHLKKHSEEAPLNAHIEKKETLTQLTSYKPVKPCFKDLDQIKKKGILRAITGYNSTSYFIYRGTPMGYDYELLKNLANHLGVKLEIKVVRDIDKMFELLESGEADVIAGNLTITKDREKEFNFTVPYVTTRQVLVQRLPDNWKKMSSKQTEASLIRNPLDLIGKKVFVRKESAAFKRMKNLVEETGGNIEIIQAPSTTSVEELMLEVASGKIDYVVTDELMAMVNQTYHENLDIATPVSFPQRISWVVSKNSPQLLEALNSWITGIKDEPVFYRIYNKYYKRKKAVEEIIKCSWKADCGTKICQYDELIQTEAETIGWDWRLLCSMIYQESRFNPTAKSWAGATGLMQLMPATAESFGIKDLEVPEESIKGGVKYLKWLEKYWEKKVSDPEERIKFILASYNVGQEHVADAQRLTEKYGKNPQKWDNNVAYFLLNKSNEKYCTDPVVRYGYCRGEEPFKYVTEVLDRYEHYKNLIKTKEEIASEKNKVLTSG